MAHPSRFRRHFCVRRLRRPGAQPLHAANAAHTANGPNARSVQFTFACVAMAGEVCNRGAAVSLSAVFSGAATPAPWASAAVGHPLRVCCAAGRSPSRARRCSDGGSGCRSGSAVESAAGAAAAAAAAAGVHAGRCAGGPPAATHAAFSSLCACLCCWLLVRVLPGLFGAGLRLCTTSARAHTLAIVSVDMAARYAWAFVAMEPR